MSDDQSQGNDEIPSLGALLASMGSIGRDSSILENRYSRDFTLRSVATETQYAHLKGLEDHYRLKKDWSRFITIIMTFMVFFQMILVMNVGLNVWDFRSYDWLLPTLMIQYFGQIVGLAYLIVGNLYEKRYGD